MSKGILNTRIIYVGGLHPQMFKDFLSMDNDYDDVVDWVSNEMYGKYISIIESEEAERLSAKISIPNASSKRILNLGLN